MTIHPNTALYIIAAVAIVYALVCGFMCVRQ